MLSLGTLRIQAANPWRWKKKSNRVLAPPRLGATAKAHGAKALEISALRTLESATPQAETGYVSRV